MFEPIPLNLPAYPFRIKKEAETFYIFDEIRKKFLVLTPEEWVRQHLVQYLISEKKYPKALFKLEGGMRLNQMQKRTDILIHDNSGRKILLAECKAPSVAITQSVFEQIARYNMTHQVPLLFVSNGLQHYSCKIDFDSRSYQFLEELPVYNAVF